MKEANFVLFCDLGVKIEWFACRCFFGWRLCWIILNVFLCRKLWVSCSLSNFSVGLVVKWFLVDWRYSVGKLTLNYNNNSSAKKISGKRQPQNRPENNNITIVAKTLWMTLIISSSSEKEQNAISFNYYHKRQTQVESISPKTKEKRQQQQRKLLFLGNYIKINFKMKSET